MSKKTLDKGHLKAQAHRALVRSLLEVGTSGAEIKCCLQFEMSHNLGLLEHDRDVRKNSSRFVDRW